MDHDGPKWPVTYCSSPSLQLPCLERHKSHRGRKPLEVQSQALGVLVLVGLQESVVGTPTPRPRSAENTAPLRSWNFSVAQSWSGGDVTTNGADLCPEALMGHALGLCSAVLSCSLPIHLFSDSPHHWFPLGAFYSKSRFKIKK